MNAAPSSQFFLPTLSATSADHWAMFGLATAALLVFAGCVPFANVQLPQSSLFIPIYESALIVSDLLTALLVFAEFVILRTRALLLIAAGYVFTASMALAHMLSFPGLFTPTGLLASGPQTTAWLFMGWHAGFPIIVLCYVFAKRGWEARSPVLSPAREVVATVGAAVLAACALMAIATLGHDWLPAVMVENRYAPAMSWTVTAVWTLSFLALPALAFSRPHSMFDLWLVVVMAAWIADVGLAAVFNAGRFDLGFYAGRIFGLLAAVFILVVLSLETVAKNRQRS
jgi:two-component system, sensor histidine kinase and response regulator